jgi:hypothetical protein
MERRRPGVDDLRQQLLEQKPTVIARRGVFDGDSHPAARASEIKAMAAEHPHDAIEPEDLWQLGRECDYRVDISLAASRADGSMTACFVRRGPMIWLTPAGRCRPAARLGAPTPTILFKRSSAAVSCQCCRNI